MAELTEQIRLYEPHRRQPRIAAIGGGHGLSAMLRGLKTYTKNITAIVTVADDGGGSGMLREDLGMLPPGDIRNCISLRRGPRLCVIIRCKPRLLCFQHRVIARYFKRSGQLVFLPFGNKKFAFL